MGRAIVREPKAFLMDEPLSNLDAKLRVSMRAELARLHERLGVTTVYVTHDQVEAMTLGERVAVMRDGVLQQVDTPQNLFNHPRNLFVAAFIGSPAMNLVEAKIDGGRVHFAGIDLPLPGGSPLAGEQQRRVILGLRPSDFEHAAGADADWARIRVKPDVVEQLGSETLLIFGIDAPPVMADAVRAASEAYSDDDGRLFAGEERAMFTASVDGKRPLGSGEIELAVDFTALHCFDPETGDALAIAGPVAARGDRRLGAVNPGYEPSCRITYENRYVPALQSVPRAGVGPAARGAEAALCVVEAESTVSARGSRSLVCRARRGGRAAVKWLAVNPFDGRAEHLEARALLVGDPTRRTSP